MITTETQETYHKRKITFKA